MNAELVAQSLTGNVILVTGAANGIGAAVAILLATKGAELILLDNDITGLEHTYDHITSIPPGRAAIYPLDLKGANTEDYAALANTIADNFNQLDALIHCAASLGQLAPFEHQNEQNWLETLHINLTAPYLLSRACLPLLKKAEHAHIIFSSDSRKNNAYWSAYGISKAAIESLAAQLTDEFAAFDQLNIHCIDPGLADTRLQRQAFPGLVQQQSIMASPEQAALHYYLCLTQ